MNGLLFESPLYDAIQKYVPAWDGVKDPELWFPFPFTGMFEVNTGLPVQVGSEKYALKVIVPVGLPNPPDRVAVSAEKLVAVASVTFAGDTEVVMEGLAG